MATLDQESKQRLKDQKITSLEQVLCSTDDENGTLLNDETLSRRKRETVEQVSNFLPFL